MGSGSSFALEFEETRSGLRRSPCSQDQAAYTHGPFLAQSLSRPRVGSLGSLVGEGRHGLSTECEFESDCQFSFPCQRNQPLEAALIFPPHRPTGEGMRGPAHLRHSQIRSARQA
jgi:hypothetical protein